MRARHLPPALALLAACGGGTPRARDTAPPTAATTAPARAPELDELVERVRGLRADDPEHRRIAAALRALASALEDLDGEAQRVARIRALAMRLEKSPRTAPHASMVANALAEALDILEAHATDPERGGVALAQAMRAYERVTPREPLLQQTEPVRTTLQAIANTLAALSGVARPFDLVAIAGAPQDVAAMRRHATRVQDLVEQIAAARGSDEARDHTIEALQALAAAIRAAPAPIERAQVAALASRVAFAASRLEQAGETSLQRADLVKSGLEAAAGALRELVDAPRGSPVSLLVERAESAARSIDEHTTFGFARAQIQDAFRAVADAYLVFATAG